MRVRTRVVFRAFKRTAINCVALLRQEAQAT